RGAYQGQQSHQKADESFYHELVDRIQIRDQVGGDRATAEAFVFGHGDALEAFDQAGADTVDDVLGQSREQTSLQHVENQRGGAQGQTQQQHQADIPGGGLPAGGQEIVHEP